MSRLKRKTNTGHAYISREADGYYGVNLPALPPVDGRYCGRAGGPSRAGRRTRKARLEDAIAWRDERLAGNATSPSTNDHRVWHRPDYNDGGPRAGSFSGGQRDDPHRRYWEELKARELIEPYDDVKLSDVKPRDLLGTTACMRLAADTEGRDVGRILVPAPIDQDLVDAAWGLHGVLVLVVPA